VLSVGILAPPGDQLTFSSFTFIVNTVMLPVVGDVTANNLKLQLIIDS